MSLFECNSVSDFAIIISTFIQNVNIVFIVVFRWKAAKMEGKRQGNRRDGGGCNTAPLTPHEDGIKILLIKEGFSRYKKLLVFCECKFWCQGSKIKVFLFNKSARPTTLSAGGSRHNYLVTAWWYFQRLRHCAWLGLVNSASPGSPATSTDQKHACKVKWKL